MKYCKTCGYELPPQPVQQGAIIEVTPPVADAGWAGLAVVLPRRPLDTNPHPRVAMITGPRKGSIVHFEGWRLRAVHGYIHIDRDGLRQADARYRVGRSFEAIPVPVRSAFNDAIYNI